MPCNAVSELQWVSVYAEIVISHGTTSCRKFAYLVVCSVYQPRI